MVIAFDSSFKAVVFAVFGCAEVVSNPLENELGKSAAVVVLGFPAAGCLY